MPHIVNAVILVAVLSVGNASTFAASRTLEALAEIGQAPKIFAYIDKKGRPLATLALVLSLGPLAFIGAYDGKIFDWLFALCGMSSFLTWYSLIRSLLILGVQYVSLISASDQLLKRNRIVGNWHCKISLIGPRLACMVRGLDSFSAACVLLRQSILHAVLAVNSVSLDFFKKPSRCQLS